MGTVKEQMEQHLSAGADCVLGDRFQFWMVCTNELMSTYHPEHKSTYHSARSLPQPTDAAPSVP